jgi:hypothetical protein
MNFVADELEIANLQNCILLTADKDFGELVFMENRHTEILTHDLFVDYIKSYSRMRTLQNIQFCPSSRKAKILTAGIH